MRLVHLLALIGLCAAVAPFISSGYSQEVPGGRAAPQQEQNGGISPEDQKKLDAFFQEIEDLLAGRDEFWRIGSKIRDDLKKEFQDNERALLDQDADSPADTEELSKLKERQNVIAQLDIELEYRLRPRDSDLRSPFDLREKVESRFKTFGNANPQLARTREFQSKERDFSMQAMRQSHRFSSRSPLETMTETLKKLSAVDSVPQRKQEVVRTHPGWQEGGIDSLPPVLEQLVTLRWNGDFLEIDRRRWDEAFADLTENEIRSRVDRLLEQAGAPERKADDNGGVFGSSQRNPRTNLQRLFDEFEAYGSRTSSYVSNDIVRLSFSSGLVSVRLTYSPVQFELLITETYSPSRVLRITETKDKLELVLSGDMYHRFLQRADDRKLMIVEVVDQEVLVYEDQSFADFYRSNTRFVEDRFFPLFNHLGLGLPASRFDPDVVSRLLKKLTSDTASQHEEAERLIASLDSDRFTKRERAFRQLAEGLEDYYDTIVEKSTDPDLSTEVRVNLKKLFDQSESNPALYCERVISALALADDVSYLEELADSVDVQAKQVIQQHIASLAE